MSERTHLLTLSAAMLRLSFDIQGGDGVANAACLEASQRLDQIYLDLCVVLPYLSQAAGKASRRSKAGKGFRAAANRLAAEVLA